MELEATNERWGLYVWEEVLQDYTAGIAVAAARSIDEAKAVILKAAEDDTYGKRGLKFDLDREAPRILDLPAGAYCHGGG